MTKVKVLIRVFGDYCASHEMSVDVLASAPGLTADSMFENEDEEQERVGDAIENSDDTMWIADGIELEDGSIYYNI